MEVVAISMDDATDAARMAAHNGIQFPVLADPTGRVARQYGVYNLLGDGVAAPATFIIGKGGTIEWRHVGRDILDRPKASEILRRLGAPVGPTGSAGPASPGGKDALAAPPRLGRPQPIPFP